jgi:hypothetical protein
LSKFQGHSAAERLDKLLKSSNFKENRTPDLSAYSTARQPTTLPRDPFLYECIYNKLQADEIQKNKN